MEQWNLSTWFRIGLTVGLGWAIGSGVGEALVYLARVAIAAYRSRRAMRDAVYQVWWIGRDAFQLCLGKSLTKGQAEALRGGTAGSQMPLVGHA